MDQPGSGKMIQIQIDSHRDVSMNNLNFWLEFYVHANRRKQVAKSELIKINRTDGVPMYFLTLDTRILGSGPLMCNIYISDPEPQWKNGNRPVMIRRNTGIGVGGAKDNPVHSIQSNWIEGYKIDFNTVWSIPKSTAYVFYGYLVNQIQSYSEITSAMLMSPENHILSVTASKLDKISCGMMKSGDKVVVLVPSETEYKATKDNGIGGKVPFDTSIMGSNGEVKVVMDGVEYDIYGEFMTVSGELFIYVE